MKRVGLPLRCVEIESAMQMMLDEGRLRDGLAVQPPL